MATLGFVVMEVCKDYEQCLGIRIGPQYPKLGVLDWTDGAKAVFGSRQAARSAIDRTEHYRLAFGGIQRPERRFCKIVPLVLAPTETANER